MQYYTKDHAVRKRRNARKHQASPSLVHPLLPCQVCCAKGLEGSSPRCAVCGRHHTGRERRNKLPLRSWVLQQRCLHRRLLDLSMHIAPPPGCAGVCTIIYCPRHSTLFFTLATRNYCMFCGCQTWQGKLCKMHASLRKTSVVMQRKNVLGPAPRQCAAGP